MAKFGKIQNFQFIKHSHSNILVYANLNDFIIYFFQNDIIMKKILVTNTRVKITGTKKT